MALLTIIFAAIVCTVLWYREAPNDDMNLSILSSLFWGAAIMWFVDAIFEYTERGAAYFTPEISKMVNDLFLGLSCVALGLIIWLVVLLIKDPKGVVKAAFLKRKL